YPRGGQPCEEADLEELEPCGTQSCVPNEFSQTDCAWSAWSSWTLCPASCGVGQIRRSRIVTEEAAHGGKQCEGLFQEFKDCNARDCPKSDCQLQGAGARADRNRLPEAYARCSATEDPRKFAVFARAAQGGQVAVS
ncbi:unnamed protein product, partial [Polarella glacialis]